MDTSFPSFTTRELQKILRKRGFLVHYKLKAWEIFWRINWGVEIFVGGGERIRRGSKWLILLSKTSKKLWKHLMVKQEKTSKIGWRISRSYSVQVKALVDTGIYVTVMKEMIYEKLSLPAINRINRIQLSVSGYTHSFNGTHT